MPTQQQLDSFYQFASSQLENGGRELSMDELYCLWREKHPTAAEFAVEFSAPPWLHLVRRWHPWRRQLYIRGKNLTVRQLVGSMKANRLSPDETAEDLGISRDAVVEALSYADQHQDLLTYEAVFEREMIEKGLGHGPAAVPG